MNWIGFCILALMVEEAVLWEIQGGKKKKLHEFVSCDMKKRPAFHMKPRGQ